MRAGLWAIWKSSDFSADPDSLRRDDRRRIFRHLSGGQQRRDDYQFEFDGAIGDFAPFLWEHFSFLITEAAEGSQTLESFQEQCRDGAIRRRVFSALAREVRRLHDAGYASPDLFTRHAFIDAGSKPPTFCWIDMARLDRERPLSAAKRARDLAALNITAPQRSTSTRERLRFLRDYCGDTDRGLLDRIDRRMQHLLKRGKFRTWKAT